MRYMRKCLMLLLAAAVLPAVLSANKDVPLSKGDKNSGLHPRIFSDIQSSVQSTIVRVNGIVYKVRYDDPNSLLYSSSYSGITAYGCTVSGGDVYEYSYSGDVYVPSYIYYNGAKFYVDGIEKKAFRNCRSLKSVTLPPAVGIPSDEYFQGCDSLVSVAVSDTVTVGGVFNRTVLPELSDGEVYVDGLLFIIDSNGEACVTRRSFFDYSGDIVIPSSIEVDGQEYPVTHIGHSAFTNCSALRSVVIPEGVVSFIKDPHPGSDNNRVYISSFQNCYNLESVTLPSTLTGIKDNLFMHCMSLRSIEIPKNVSEISAEAFEGCSGLVSITVNPDNEVYDSRGGCNAIIESATNTLIVGCANTVIPDDVEVVGKRAFFVRNGLTSINIPENVRRIEQYAFAWCADLRNVRMSEGLEYIGREAFSGCNGITSVVVPESVDSLERRAFGECTRLLKARLPEGLSYLAPEMFYYCKCLTEVNIPQHITRIEYSTFEECYCLESLDIPECVTHIGNRAFAWCTSLSRLDIPAGIKTIGSYVFYDCDNLHYISLPDDRSGFSDNAFTGFTGLRSIDLPKEMREIKKQAFGGCSSLEYIELPDSIRIIGDEAFVGCHSLTSINIPANVSSISVTAFKNCENLRNVDFDERNTHYKYYDGLFLNSRGNVVVASVGTPEIVIPDFVEVIGESALTSRDSIESLSVRGNTIFHKYAFGKYSFLDLVSVTLRDTITPGVMRNFPKSVSALRVADDVRYVPEYAFADNKPKFEINTARYLKEIVIEGCPAIGKHSFYSCDSIRTITLYSDVPPKALPALPKRHIEIDARLLHNYLGECSDVICEGEDYGILVKSFIKIRDIRSKVGQWRAEYSYNVGYPGWYDVSCIILPNSISANPEERRPAPFDVELSYYDENGVRQTCRSDYYVSDTTRTDTVNVMRVFLPAAVNPDGGNNITITVRARVTSSSYTRGYGNTMFLDAITLDMCEESPADGLAESADSVFCGTFPDNVLAEAQVVVPPASLSSYQKAAGWRQFRSLGMPDTVRDIVASDGLETVHYGLDGRIVTPETSGIHIVKYSDGAVRKVYVP